MFERFTDRARRVVVLAQEAARSLGHDRIGTEHVLLGLIHEGNGVGAKVLEAQGIGLQVVQQRVEDIIGRGEQAPAGHIPFTEQAKGVLRRALGESTELGHHYIGTEHILLALISQGEGVAARVLTELGVDLDGARAEVIRLLDEYRRNRGHQAG
jgi:ATP-dependent Clp protease ATP-binding subunit ClpC